MDEHDLRRLIGRVKRGRLSRRGFIGRMAAVGLTAPLANQLLAIGGVAMAQPASQYKPTRRGGGGTLKVLWWQAPTLLNPHFAVGTKDTDASRLFYEPLAGWDVNGNMVLTLAAEIPSVENGDLSEDGRSVIWKLRRDVKWHDGEPFTADDVVFNWEYARDPKTAAVTSGTYTNIKVEKIDPYSVRVEFPVPTPFWATAFVGAGFGQIIPKHLFEPFIGSKSRDAPTNLKPVGTGPYKFKEFRPGDLVTGELNPDYYQPNRPYFDAIEMKGGGDAVSAARAVLETGEYDFAWNLQVEDEVLKKMEVNGKGTVQFTPGGSNVEHLQLNNTDPWTEVDGERSSLKTKHPTLSDPAVRQALNLLVDRSSVQKFIYGREGATSANYINGPPRFDSKNTKWEFNVAKAADILEKAGWTPGPDGVRAKDGKTLKYVFQTSINQPRQETQQIIKQACRKAGIDIDIKAVVASVYFSSDVANPDTYTKFYTDLQMYTTFPGQPDPGIWMRGFLSSEAATKANKWQGVNITRWQNPEYDRTWDAQSKELDPVKRAALMIKLNDLVIDNIVVIPVLYRYSVTAAINGLYAPQSGWDTDTWAIADWFKQA